MFSRIPALHFTLPYILCLRLLVPLCVCVLILNFHPFVFVTDTARRRRGGSLRIARPICVWCVYIYIWICFPVLTYSNLTRKSDPFATVFARSLHYQLSAPVVASTSLLPLTGTGNQRYLPASRPELSSILPSCPRDRAAHAMHTQRALVFVLFVVFVCSPAAAKRSIHPSNAIAVAAVLDYTASGDAEAGSCPAWWRWRHWSIGGSVPSNSPPSSHLGTLCELRRRPNIRAS